MRWGACQGLVHPFQYAKTVREDLVVPEAQHPVALLPQEPVSLLVGGVGFRVLAAVQLDEQLFRQAGEVGDVGADGLLAAKFVAAQLFVAEVVPQKTFGVGLVLAQGLGVLQGFGGVLAFDVRPGAWGLRGAGFPPPARLRTGVLVSPTPLKGGVISSGPRPCFGDSSSRVAWFRKAALARTGSKSTNQDLNSARAMASSVSFMRRFSSILSSSVPRMWAMARCSGGSGTTTGIEESML